MNDLRKYLIILEEVKDLLTNLPESCESYCDTFYDDINYLIDKMESHLEVKEVNELNKK